MLNFIKASSLVILLTLLSGCSQKVVHFSEKKVGSKPLINVENSADIGDSLYEEYDYMSTPIANTVENVDLQHYLGKINISNNTPMVKVIIGDDVQYCSDMKTYIDPLVGAYGFTCFKSDYKTNQFTEVRVPNIMLGSWKQLDKPIPFKESTLNASTKGMKKELLYNGNYKGEIKIQYREYINDFARPAFYQDISFELQSNDNQVSIKGVNLLILGQEKNKIHYKVTSGFKK